MNANTAKEEPRVSKNGGNLKKAHMAWIVSISSHSSYGVETVVGPNGGYCGAGS